MVDFYLPIKILKERLSPTKEGDALRQPSALHKRPLSEDDPFNDTKKAKPSSGAHTNVAPASTETPFIKRINLSKMHGDAVPASTSEAPNQTVARIDNELLQPQSKLEAPLVSSQDLEEAAADESELDEADEVPLEVLEDMHKLETCFPTLSSNYRLLDKIGEGTFSTVYKAVALGGVIKLGSEIWTSPPLKRKRSSSSTATLDSVATRLHAKRKNPIVALKLIYVTSSPGRIHNELKLLFLLSGNLHVAPLLDVLRYQDQVLAIMPYYQHADYRDFYRDLPIKGVKKYMWELMHALAFIHSKDVIHRDLKPTNFLYDPFKGKGVLVDFGLAEKVDPTVAAALTGVPLAPAPTGLKSLSCPCLNKERHGLSRITRRHNIKAAYPKQDQRPPRRANRAGTRGFRAPEVLFKCTNQLTKLDVWSAGIIGLSFITRKFPLFNSPDDIDAVLELVLIFGLDKLQQCAELHGCGLDISLPHISSSKTSGNLIKVVADFLRFEWENRTLPDDSVALDTLKLLSKSGESFVRPLSSSEAENYQDHADFMEMLGACFSMDPTKRASAKEVLQMPFFEELFREEDDEVIF